MPPRNPEPSVHEAVRSERPFGPQLARPSEELPRALRPREKLFARGPRCLSSVELITLLLGGTRRREPAQCLAQRLLRRHGVRGLAGLEPRAWLARGGLSEAAAGRLCAAFELGRRAHAREREAERTRLSSPRHVYRQLRRLARARKEHLIGLYLDSQNRLLHQETISIGSLNTTRTHPREILYPAIAHLALGFILAHNHPSGCLEPSPEDLEFTRGVQRAAGLMGIELYDHLIIGAEGYVSLRERGLL